MSDVGGDQTMPGGGGAAPTGPPIGPPAGFHGGVHTPAPVGPSPGTPPPPPGFGGGAGVGPSAGAPAPGFAPPPAFPPGPPLPPGAVPTPAPPGTYGAPGGYGGYAPPPLPTRGPSPTRDLIGRGGGLPPSVGLAIVLAGFPAVGLTVYGLLLLFVGTVLSSYESDFRDAGFPDDGSVAAAAGIFGAGLLVIGVLFLVSVVFAAAGSRGGRTGTTFFIGGWLLLTLLISLASVSDSPSSLIGWVVIASPGLYVLYALWGRPGRGVF